MVEKFLLCSLTFVSLIGWGAFGALIARTTPETFVARLFFFAILFVSASFTCSSLAYYLTLRIANLNRREGRLRLSILLGIPPAAATVAAMWLQSLRALGLVSGLILLGAALVAELIMSVSGRRNSDIRRIQETSD